MRDKPKPQSPFSSGRLLALAFASADLLLEVDPQLNVSFAAGSLIDPQAGPAHALISRSLAEVVSSQSHGVIANLLANLKAGARGGPVDIVLQTETHQRPATFRALLVPDFAPGIFCAIAYSGPLAKREPDILDAASFARHAMATVAASQGGQPLSLAFVEITGLVESLKTLDSAAAKEALAKMEAVLKRASFEGRSAARIADERYALVKEVGASDDSLAAELQQTAREHDIQIEAQAASVQLSPQTDPGVGLRALRFALDGFIRDGVGADPSLMDSKFSQVLLRTMRDVESFRVSVRDGTFKFFYQPVVRLDSGQIHHYEALARFDGAESPADIIRMAEDLGLMSPFDHAVVHKALGRLRVKGAGALKLAINVSAASVTSESYVEELLRATSAKPAERKRLLIEVTETTELENLNAANAMLQRLRGAGFKVCIDDFGSGAASLDYIRALAVDAVKIDGKYIDEIVADKRLQTMVRHIVELCTSLDLETIAERIETAEAAALLRRLGVQFGQGYHYGRPEAEPRPMRASA